jgi:putative ABC transport system substrate-binding protein
MVIDWRRYGLGEHASGISVELPVDALLTRFKLLLPNLRRLGVIYSDQASSTTHADAGAAAAELGIELVREPVGQSEDVPGAYRRIRSEIDALWMIPDPVVVTHDNFRYLAGRTLHDDVAFLAFSENFVRAGALLSVSPDYATMGSQAAALIDRMVASNASPPAVQAPIGSSLVINAATARSLGIDVDMNMLSLADKVIDSDE